MPQQNWHEQFKKLCFDKNVVNANPAEVEAFIETLLARVIEKMPNEIDADEYVVSLEHIKSQLRSEFGIKEGRDEKR